MDTKLQQNPCHWIFGLKKDLSYNLSIKNNLYRIIDLAFSSRRKTIKKASTISEINGLSILMSKIN